VEEGKKTTLTQKHSERERGKLSYTTCLYKEKKWSRSAMGRKSMEKKKKIVALYVN